LNRKEHELESIKLFGKPFTEVHAWLDELAWKNGKFDPYHRKYRHTMEGVNHIRKIYGKCAKQVAIRHILSDLTGFGWWTKANGIPKNTNEFEEWFGDIIITTHIK
jgi:hypothetical protein